VPSERLVEQDRIRTLDYDRQPLEYERPFSTVIIMTVIIISAVI